ncbi:MAG: hypothetical protein AB7Q81_21710 [Gammaproteobacteria bacterium]
MTVTDANGVDNLPLPVATITVVPGNDEPTLTATGVNPGFVENGVAQVLYAGAVANTVEAAQTFTGLTLTVTNVVDGPAERLNIDGSAVTLTDGNGGTTATNGLTFAVTVGGGTATVTLTKGAGVSVAALQTVVNTLSYQHTSDDPTAGGRTVTLTSVTDSGANGGNDDNVASLALTSTVNVIAVNDEPTFSATGSNPTFTEDGGVAVLYTGASANTIEATQTFTGLTLTVTNVVNGASEVLNADGTGIALTNGNGGTTAGNGLTIAVTLSGSTATLTLSGGNLSAAALQTLVNGLSYQNTSQDPTGGSRVVTLTSVTDSGLNIAPNDAVATLNVVSTVTVVPVNDEPTLSATGSNPTFTENGSSQLLYTGAAASTVEATQTFTGLTLTVSNVANGTSEKLTVNGVDVDLVAGGPVAVGPGGLVANVGVGGGTATVTLSGGTLSAGQLQTLVNGLSYRNTSEDPTGGTRTVTLTSVTDSGSNVAPDDAVATLNLVSTVTVTPVNDEPTLSATGVNPTYTEDGAVADLYSGVTASTVEAAQTFTGLTLTVTNVVNGASERLSVDGSTVQLTNGNSGTTATNGLGFAVTVSGGLATVTLTGGTLSAAALQTLVDGLGYQNVSQDPTGGSRVVTLTSVTDSGSNVAPNDAVATLNVVSTVTVVPVNDEPTLSATGSDPTFTENGSSQLLYTGAAASTVEATQTFTGLTLTVSNVANGTSEKLTVNGVDVDLVAGGPVAVGPGGLVANVGVGGGTATVTLSGGTLSAAALQTLVDGLSYHNTSEDPTAGTRTVTLTSVTDSGSNVAPNDAVATLNLVSTVTVDAVNDAPAFSGIDATPNYIPSGGTPVTLDANGTVLDAELGNRNDYTGATLTIRRDGASAVTVDGVADGDDEFGFDTAGALFTVNGTALEAGGQAFATFDVTTTPGALVVTFDSAATTATQALVNDVLQRVTYRNDTDTGAVRLEYVMNDGNAANAQGTGGALDGTTAITVGISERPVVDLNGGGTGNGINFSSTFTESGSVGVHTPIAAVDATTTVTDPDGGDNLASITITLAGNVDGVLEVLNVTAGGGVSASGNGTGSITLTGAALPAAYETVLRTLTYDHTGDDPTAGARTISVTATDQHGVVSTVATSTITVVPTNDAPFNAGGALPSDIAAIQNAATNVNLSTLNLQDVDENSLQVLTLDLQTAGANGTLAASNGGGVTVGGTATLMTLTGTLANLNTYINNASAITYTGPTVGENIDTLAVTINDNDGSGAVALGSINFDVTNPVPATTSITLANLDGATGFKLNGINGNATPALRDFTGTAVTVAGDLNGDGFADMVVTARRAELGNFLPPDAGEAYVVFGASRATWTSRVGGTTGFNLGTLDGTNGFVVRGDVTGAQTKTTLGTSLAAGGDYNGDAIPDILLGEGFEKNPNGAVVVYGDSDPGDLGGLNGLDATTLDGASDFNADGVDDGARFDGLSSSAGTAQSAAVGSGGDIDNDGIDDILVGNGGIDFVGRTDAGSAFLVFGSGSLDALADLGQSNGTNVLSFAGDAANRQVGLAVNGIGDINGDGFADFAIGQPSNDTTAGVVHVVFGNSRTALATLASNLVGSSLAVQLTGTNGFTITGPSSVGAKIGAAGITGIGDFNGDGFDDFFLGDTTGGGGTVVYGRGTAFPDTLSLNSLFTNQSTGFHLRGIGSAVAAAGDINGDGLADIVLGGELLVGNNAFVLFGHRDIATSGFLVNNQYLEDLGKVGNAVIDFSDGRDFHGVVAADPDGPGYLLLNPGDPMFGAGIRLVGVNGSSTGFSVGGGGDIDGDIDGDGFDDIMVGAPDANNATQTNGPSGQAYVVYGQDFGFVGDPAQNVTATGADKLIGSAHDDVLSSGGNAGVVMRGGAGDDVLRVNAGEASVDGGGGFDILTPDANGIGLNFDALTDKLGYRNVESIQLNGFGTNALALDVRDVLEMSGAGRELILTGVNAENDAISLTGGWSADGAVNRDVFVAADASTQNLAFDVFVHNDLTVLIQGDLTNVTVS